MYDKTCYEKNKSLYKAPKKTSLYISIRSKVKCRRIMRHYAYMVTVGYGATPYKQTKVRNENVYRGVSYQHT